MTTATTASAGAAAAMHATAPSALLRRPPPAAPVAASGEAPRTVVTARLAEHATAATEAATGLACFTVVLHQAAGAPPIVATRWVGQGPDAAAYARERAAALGRGCRVTVHAGGMRLRYRDGEMAVVLAGVRDIEIDDEAACASVPSTPT